VSFLAVVVLFGALLWLLCLGGGLLVGRLAGIRLAAPLLFPVGFGLLVVVSQFTTRAAATAPLTPWVLAALALLGFVLCRAELAERWRARRPGWWWGALAALGAYVLVTGPVLAAARLTFPGYLLDTTGAIQLAGAEWLLHHGNHFPGTIPGYGTTLVNYFGNGYPSGGHTVLAAAGWLSGQNLLWLYDPFEAVELSLVALTLYYLAGRVGLPRWAAAVTGALAATGALVYSYALMGSIKEITALPMLILMGALLVVAGDLRDRFSLRSLLPFAVAAAAALGAIGIAASPWVVLFAVGLLAVVMLGIPHPPRRTLRRLPAVGVALAAAVALLALPTVGPLSQSLSLAKSVSASNPAAVNDPGNLLRPLRFVQSLGIWLGESHRVDPRYLNQTYVLIGLVAVGIVFGLIGLVRRRAWSVLLFVAISFAVWEILTHRGTEWTDAKLLMLLSPVLLFAAFVGAFGLIGVRTLEGVLLGAAIAAGVLGSDALAYHATNMAPTKRYTELLTIGQRFAGQGPTLTPDFDEYALYALRDMRDDSPGLAYAGPFEYVPGVGGSYGHSYDLDSLALGSVERYRMIVMRRSPTWSRPPSNFTRVWKGPYYTVWRRTGPAPLVHVPLGAVGVYQPSAVPRCSVVRGLAARAQQGGDRLAYAARPINVLGGLATATHSPSVLSVPDLESRPQLNFTAPGRIETSFEIETAGRYELWLGAYVDRPLHVLVDGRQVAAPSGQSGDDGTMVDVVSLRLRAGHHRIALLRYGGGLGPGNNAGAIVDGIVFEPAGAQDETVSTVPPSAWRTLCGRPLDWVEIVGA
jgi:hypothetical protein